MTKLTLSIERAVVEKAKRIAKPTDERLGHVQPVRGIGGRPAQATGPRSAL